MNIPFLMAKAGNNSRKFHLKPFSLFHHRATIKVGMDSLLLGIWIEAETNLKILDVGAGSGILSLLLAGKCNAEIEAVELDHDSAVEAEENFRSSPFYHRLFLIEEDFNHFSEKGNQRYDLIISNPPFFINDSRSGNKKKNWARHGDYLSYGQLIDGVKKLLLPGGKFCLVLPYVESRIFLSQSSKLGLKLQKQQLIFPVRGLQPNRINMQLGFEEPEELTSDSLVIREEDRSFSKEYQNFVKDLLIAV